MPEGSLLNIINLYILYTIKRVCQSLYPAFAGVSETHSCNCYLRRGTPVGVACRPGVPFHFRLRRAERVPALGPPPGLPGGLFERYIVQADASGTVGRIETKVQGSEAT